MVGEWATGAEKSIEEDAQWMHAAAGSDKASDAGGDSKNWVLVAQSPWEGVPLRRGDRWVDMDRGAAGRRARLVELLMAARCVGQTNGKALVQLVGDQAVSCVEGTGRPEGIIATAARLRSVERRHAACGRGSGSREVGRECSPASRVQGGGASGGGVDRRNRGQQRGDREKSTCSKSTIGDGGAGGSGARSED